MYFKHRYANIFYEKEGEKKDTIIILSGWGNTRKTFQYFINHLKQDFTIYSLDYPSFGNSPLPNKELTIEDYATIIKDFIKENNIKNPIIIAHSFGGRITAILLGRMKIQVKKVILIDVAGIKRIKVITKLKTLLYKIIKKTCILLNNQKLLQTIRHHFSSKDYQELSPTMYKTFQNIIQEDLKKDYQNFINNVLIIWGEKDQDTPLKDAYLLHRIIKNSGLIIYKNTKHFSYLEKPYQTLIIIQHFLKEKDMD